MAPLSHDLAAAIGIGAVWNIRFMAGGHVGDQLGEDLHATRASSHWLLSGSFRHTDCASERQEAWEAACAERRLRGVSTGMAARRRQERMMRADIHDVGRACGRDCVLTYSAASRQEQATKVSFVRPRGWLSGAACDRPGMWLPSPVSRTAA